MAKKKYNSNWSDVDICDLCGCRRAVRYIQVRKEGKAHDFEPRAKTACKECRKKVKGRFRYTY